jgi:hypothetical protein
MLYECIGLLVFERKQKRRESPLSVAINLFANGPPRRLLKAKRPLVRFSCDI